MLGRKILVAIVAFNLIGGQAFAAGGMGSGRDSDDFSDHGERSLGLSLQGELGNAGVGSEFVSGNFPGAILMPVNLWGAVGKPGIHHIPTHTDLVTLLSLAGGPMGEAKMDQVLIKRRTAGDEQVIKVNVEDMLTTPGIHSPVLEANDIVIIPREKPAISNNTVAVLTFVGTLVGLTLAGFALADRAKQH